MTTYQGKYRRLHSHLRTLGTREWQATFGEIEAIVGFNLPNAAHDHRAWWANDKSHTHARAWLAAGWETTKVNMDSETLLFRRKEFYAPDEQSSPRTDALSALDELQTTLAEREVNLAGWAQDLRAERRAAEPR